MTKNLDKLLQDKMGIKFSEALETTAYSLNLQTARIFTHIVISKYWESVYQAIFPIKNYIDDTVETTSSFPLIILV